MTLLWTNYAIFGQKDFIFWLILSAKIAQFLGIPDVICDIKDVILKLTKRHFIGQNAGIPTQKT